MAKKNLKRKRGERGGGSLTLRGTVWLARWTDKNGRPHSRSTGERDREAAEEKLRLYTSEVIENTQEKAKARAIIQYDGRIAEERAFRARQKEATPALSLSEGWEAYLGSPNPDASKRRKNRKASAATLVMMECQYRVFTRWVSDTYGAEVTEMRQITPAVANEFCDMIRTTRSANTLNKYIALLSRIWRFIMANGNLDARILENPFDGIETEDMCEHIREPITEDQFREILKHVSGEMKTFFLLGYECGLRQGDAACLVWKDVNFDKHRIEYTPHKTKRAATKAYPPIPARLFAQLSKTPPAERVGYVLPEIAARYMSGRRRGLVAEVHRILEESGIETQGETTDGETRARNAISYGFHSLRHGYISNLGNDNISLDLAKQYAGHVSEDMSRRYFHVDDESNARTRRVLDARAERAAAAEDTEAPAIGAEAAETPLEVLAGLLEKMDTRELEEAARMLAAKRKAGRK
jgi:integrase